MTTLSDHTPSSADGDAGQLTPGHDVDLPADPFVALRVAFGMLLGEDDFRVLMGNPRGKQMLHGAWLHGRGVVWGMRVERDGDQLVVRPGLAVDAHGRKLHLDAACCLPLREWAQDWQQRHPEVKAGGKAEEIAAWVVAEFAGCLDRPIPALADPCDVTRVHDDWSRVVESVSIVVRPDRPASPVPYLRVRALLGLDEPGDGATTDPEVLEAIRAVEAARPDRRPLVLLEQFRLLAAHDAMDCKPQLEEGDVGPGRYPVTDRDAGVVLARLSVQVTDHDGCVSIGEVEVDPDVRRTLLPTSTIQELACGKAPTMFGVESRKDAGGPRLKRGTVHWSKGNSRVSFQVTAPIAEESQESGIEVSSLSHQGRGWNTSHIDQARLYDGGTRVVVDLDNSPAYRTVRLVIRGTGPTPLFGRDPHVPFAGVEGGPPGTEEDGHDAVDTRDLGSGYEEWRAEQ
jgi:hypothetical protein